MIKKAKNVKKNRKKERLILDEKFFFLNRFHIVNLVDKSENGEELEYLLVYQIKSRDAK